MHKCVTGLYRSQPLNKYFLLLVLLAGSPIASANATPAFTRPDLSGIYDCTGNDEHEGRYAGTVTLEPVPGQSTGRFGA
jgi:hypothetical protein